MSTTADLLATPPRTDSADLDPPDVVRVWLDALAAGVCNHAEFVRAADELFPRGPDASWEILSQLDQYYRRGKISLALFQKLKSRFQSAALGSGAEPDYSVPLPRAADAACGPASGVASRTSPDAAPLDHPRVAAPEDRIGTAPGDRPSPATIRVDHPRVAVQGTAPVDRIGAAPVDRPGAARVNQSGSVHIDRTSADVDRVKAADDKSSGASHDVVPGIPPVIPRNASPDAAGPSSPDAVQELPRPAPPRPGVNDLLRGRYRLLKALGRGGTGIVFEALDQYLADLPIENQRLAIKVLDTAVTERTGLFAELRREFLNLQSLSHPNIVRVHEFDRDGDTAFFTMELLSGSLLSRVLRQTAGALNRASAFAIIREIGDALVHAHSRGIVHGDISPKNVFITIEGQVRVLDFGASHASAAGPFVLDAPQPVAVAAPAYASCQLFEGLRADARDDVYALACMAYVLLTGRHPFRDHTSVKARSLRMAPRRPPGLTHRQWQALRAGLHFERERRPADVEEWLRLLDLRHDTYRLPGLSALMRLRPPSSYWKGVYATIALLLLVAAAGVWATKNRESLAGLIAGLTAAKAAPYADASVTRAKVPPTVAAAGGGEPLAPSAAADQRSKPADAARGAASAESNSAPDRAPVAGSGDVDSSHTAGARIAGSGDVDSLHRAGAPVAGSGDVDSPHTAGAPIADIGDVDSPPTPNAAVPAPGDSPTAAESARPTTAYPTRAYPPTASPTPVAAAQTPNVSPVRTASIRSPGIARVELAADTTEIVPGASSALIAVRRSGSLRNDAAFTWWTESGTAKPGADFEPVARRVEHIGAGRDYVSLSVPVVSGSTRRSTKSFYVVIDGVGGDAEVSLGPRTVAMVSLLPSE